jgi:hypothetical protein
MIDPSELVADDFDDAELGAAWRDAIAEQQANLDAVQAELTVTRAVAGSPAYAGVADRERDLRRRVVVLADTVIALGLVLEVARRARTVCP